MYVTMSDIVQRINTLHQS